MEQKEVYYEYMHRDLFSYAKGFQENWEDPNTALIVEFREAE